MSFDDYLVSHEGSIRLILFSTTFLLMALWEVLAPRRRLNHSRSLRWTNNLGLVFLNSIILRLLFPTAAVGSALLASGKGWGLFNQFELDPVVSVLASLVILDLAIYWQHVLMHYFPVLWRFHRVHHADLDYDLTTGARFHSVEIIFSMILKVIIIILLGAPALAVFVFEVILSSMAVFNHSNVKLPDKLDRVLRVFFVTPDMHRVHHSIIKSETNSNYGFNLSIWDRVFGSYRPQPSAGHTAMTIGLSEFRTPQQASYLLSMLKMPFIRDVDVECLAEGKE